MNRINHYYKFVKNPKYKTIYDLEKYSDVYNPLHNPNKKGDVKIKLSNAEYIQTLPERKPDYTLQQNNKHISSIFFFDLDNPGYALGDIRNTRDALLFILNPQQIEILILKNKKPFIQTLKTMLSNGELDDEIEGLRLNSIDVNEKGNLAG